MMTRMVSVRHNSSSNGGGGDNSTSRVTLYSASLAIFCLTAIYLLSNTFYTSTTIISAEPEVSPQMVMMNTVAKNTATAEDYERDEEGGGDLLAITQGSVTYTSSTLDYYHCGPLPTKSNPQLSELVLLHGAAFTKEDWKSSGILDKLCEINNNEDGGDLSITAWDLPVSATGDTLIAAYNAMVNEKRLSGNAVTFVTPSASGKALTSLAEIVFEQDAHPQLKLLVKGWIPVASGAVLKTSDEALLKYVHANIPVLAIHGDQDAMGKKVTERLVKLASAKGVELEGRHPVYLDSPDEFVMEVIKFMDENWL